MLSGSAILRISVLLVVAGCLAAIIQFLLPHNPSMAPEAPPAAARPPVPAPRKVETLPVPEAAPTTAPAPMPEAAPRAEGAKALPTPPADPDPPPATTPASPQPTGEASVAEAADTAGPRALALVDLNTGSLAELNALRGGGSIGRAILQRRPYTSIDQLLSKRVLSRATYEKIKDQVTVR